MFTQHPVQAQPISRKSLAWLLAVQVFILAPHFVTVPVWIALVWMLVAVWRWRIFQGAWNYPSKMQKFLLVFACCGGLLLSLGASFRFESMVSLLLIGFALKLLELKNKQDFVLLVFIALFILAAQFIQFNHFLAAFYGLGCLTLLCAALMQLYKESAAHSIWPDVRGSFYLLLQAIPLMLILFVVMPRMGSFWAVPAPQQSKTGMSDSMSPGDFTELIESDELAFRVSFVGGAPAREKLYWRSLVFSAFDGRRWLQSREQQAGHYFSQAATLLQSHLIYKGEPIEYTLIAEASGKPWLYSLAAPQVWPEKLGLAQDMRLFAFEPINERMSYKVTAALDYQLNEMSAEELAQNTLIPKTGNRKTRERAQAWLAETGSPEKLIEKIFAYYHQSFFYTLKPPALGADLVDDFLWDSRQGFCEHFASSFVFFMRAAGVPARVVVGYQGGTLNSVDGSLSVRQRDAHAWAEVWLAERGWVMFDPTAAVAPERIQKGIEQSLSPTDRQLLTKPFGSSIRFLSLMREQWDAVNLTWVQWVMNYDSSQQLSLLERVLGEVSALRIALVVMLAASVLSLLLFVGLSVRNRKRNIPESVQLYLQLCKKLKACGFTPLLGETPRQFVARVSLSRPVFAPALAELVDLYERFTYGENPELAACLRSALERFRPKA